MISVTSHSTDIPNSPQSRCEVCHRSIPGWDLHLKCVSHWDRDCSRLSPYDVCQVWSPWQWDYVDRTVAHEEAKAFLKTLETKPGKRRRKAVLPTDVSGERTDKVISDNSMSPNFDFCVNDAPVASNVSFSTSNRSPETRRRREALDYARKTESMEDYVCQVGQGYASSPPHVVGLENHR